MKLQFTRLLVVTTAPVILGGTDEIDRFTERALLFSLLSGIRFTSSAVAVKLCRPGVAFQVLAPVGPPSADRLTEAPGASALVKPADQLTLALPSMLNPIPRTTPEGVGPVPWFFTVAWKVTLLPAKGGFGVQLIPVTIRSGRLTLGMVTDTWPELALSPTVFRA